MNRSLIPVLFYLVLFALTFSGLTMLLAPTQGAQPALSAFAFLPFVISSGVVGFVVVFVVPFIKSNLETIPQLAALTSNRFVQVVFVGAIAMLGIGIFGGLARRFR